MNMFTGKFSIYIFVCCDILKIGNFIRPRLGLALKHLNQNMYIIFDYDTKILFHEFCLKSYNNNL